MKLVYGVKDKPKFSQLLIFAFQQILAIMAATIVVPVIINGNANLTGANAMSQSAALFGAGVGTIVYLLFTKFKSPVFLGSSFAFLGPMTAAFTGATTSVALGYVGLILGAVFAGLVYVVLAVVVKIAGVKWISKLMPPVVIGPTVAIIGLSLAGNAISDVTKGNVSHSIGENWVIENGEPVLKELFAQDASVFACLACALLTLAVVCLSATYGKKMAKLIPFILGILSGYGLATIFTIIGNAADIPALRIINFSALTDLFKNVDVSSFVSVPEFTFLTAFGGFKEIDGGYIASVAVAYVPVAFVVFAEHIADHKNLSSIIESDLLEEPGLHRTLLGDGIGSIAGAIFGGCPNTTYGESVGCVAITGNASVVTILTAAIGCILISFLSPFVAFLSTIPSCVMGGVCMALYGFIAVSGLKMLQKVDLEQNKNLFVTSTILISGIGGLTLTFGKVTLTTIAIALILGILVNIMLSKSPTDAE